MPGNNIDWNGIEGLRLFTRPTHGLEYKSVPLETARSLYQGETYLDAAALVWENYRTTIINANLMPEWETVFDKAKNIAHKAYQDSKAAKFLVNYLNVDESVFISDLPCSGAAMERLIHKDWRNKFFNDALAVYQSGYWICGIKNGKFVICGETPNE